MVGLAQGSGAAGSDTPAAVALRVICPCWRVHQVAVRPTQHLLAELRSCCTSTVARQGLDSSARVLDCSVCHCVASALPMLLQDIVTASPRFSVEGFIPRLRDYLRVTNPYKRQFLISWVRKHSWHQHGCATAGCGSHSMLRSAWHS